MKRLLFAALLAATSTAAMAQPVETTDDTPEEIAADAARDLKDNRFYNRPGATRADYDRDWQECRLIARGSRTPGGVMTLYDPSLYNPAISPMAGAIGGGIGAAIGAAIVEGQQRRANRRTCLLIRGWRLVEPPAGKTSEIAAMNDVQRDAYFASIVGAQTVEGEITALDNFESVAGPPASMGGAPAGTPTLFLGKKAPAQAPLDLREDEGAVMIVFRRNDAGSMGRSGSLELRRYDAEKGNLAYQPRDWKKRGDMTTYHRAVASRDRKAPYEVQIVKLTAGDYVISADAIGKAPSAQTFCFGAPTFRVEAGKIVYLTDAIPFIDAEQPDGSKITGLGYARDYAEAGKALAALRPDLVGSLVDGEIRNGSTYACAGPVMTRRDYPGIAAQANQQADSAAQVPSIAASGGAL